MNADGPEIEVPANFEITVWADDVPNARAMAMGEDGTIYIGSRSAGNVYAIPDANGDNKADEVILIAEKLKLPVGVSYLDGDLYISAVSKIYKISSIKENLRNEPELEKITDAFPTETHHGWKFIDVGPDGKLYVPVGAPCNICEEDPDQYANIMRMDLDGSNLETYARGVRNTVGFDWHPETGELWFTDNGRDWMGDDLPPCELNHAPNPDMHFGYPYCHGTDIPDPEFGEGKNCEDYIPPKFNFGAHTAPLGICFYDGDQFPDRYTNDIFVALHGSWNRSTKVGYKVLHLDLDENGNVLGSKDFLIGMEVRGEVIGRPVDVLVYKDGSLLVSDDHAGKIYQIKYTGQ